MTEQNVAFSFSETFAKIDEEQRLVFGWASVVEQGGAPVVDYEGDTIDPRDLQDAAHGFILDSRQAKVMHEGSPVGEVVESVVFTRELQNALGIDLGKVGWMIGMKIYSDQVWQDVKDGRLKMFSIGGKGKRIGLDNG